MPLPLDTTASREERLAEVYRRAARHRAQPRRLLIGAGAAAVLAVVLAVATTGEGSPRHSLVAGGPSSTMSPPTSMPPAATPTTESPATTETTAAPPTTAAPAPPSQLPTTTTAPTTTTVPDPGAPLWGRSFVSTSVTEGGRDHPLVAGTDITVTFERSEGNGGARWNAGCNTAGAPLTVHPDRLDLGEIGSTAVGCPTDRADQDRWVSDFFGADPYWRLDADGLTLTSGDRVIRFRSAG